MKRTPKLYGIRYPWRRWFKRSPFVLVRGKHFPATVQAYVMAQMVRNAASQGRDGTEPCRVRIKIAPDGNSLSVTVLPQRSKRAGAELKERPYPVPPLPGD